MYLGLLLAYAEKYGFGLISSIGREAAKGKLPAFDRDTMRRFLLAHEITQTEFSQLLGFTTPKAVTDWKNAGDAPNYIKILVAAIEKCGIELMHCLKGGRDVVGHKTLFEATSMKTVVDSFNLPDVPVTQPAPVQVRAEKLDTPEITKALSLMSARDRDILISRKFSPEPMTLEALGEKYNISRQRVQQIEASGMNKLASLVD